ncbi:MAG: type II toxin-antitoxin system PemK/MazF family toxin [Gemmatimonadetes bacterium]|nr:type II toxin-antitoxin system PemK/MazF family toxin [Gemmatimonadota bacterium]
MPSTTTYRRGQVVVVNVPFSDASGTKRRPALVVSADPFHRALPDLIVCPISSQPRYYERPGAGDHPLRDWRAAGLRHPSTVRVSKVLAVDKRIVGRVLGAASARDLTRLSVGLRAALGLGRR